MHRVVFRGVFRAIGTLGRMKEGLPVAVEQLVEQTTDVPGFKSNRNRRKVETGKEEGKKEIERGE